VTTAYGVYGLTVSCARPVFGDAPTVTCENPDVIIVHAAEEVAPHRPRGDDIMLTYRREAVDYYCERTPDGSLHLVFVGACEFDVSAGLDHVTVRRHVGAVEGIEDVLTAGALMAFLLYMRDLLVLHASAVEIDGRIVAFTGGSGRGKSTMATLLCAAGASILTDDLLRVEFEDGAPIARKGSADLRLRKGADELASTFLGEAPDQDASADARQLLRPPSRARDRLPLAAIFLPIPTREEATVRIERLPPTQAVFVLLNTPRLFGWLDPDVRARQFTHMSTLLAQVPLYFVHVPWGPPFDPSIAEAIRAELSLDRPASAVQLVAE